MKCNGPVALMMWVLAAHWSVCVTQLQQNCGFLVKQHLEDWLKLALGEFLGDQPVCRNVSKDAFGWVNLKIRITEGSWLTLQNDISSGNYSSVYINVFN
jgi:hypothetical protein